MDAESRVTHPRFGAGTITATLFTAGSNLPAARVVFDQGPERVLLLSALTPSKVKVLKAAPPIKKTRRRKATSPPEEAISDRLLVASLDDTVMPVDPTDELDELATL